MRESHIENKVSQHARKLGVLAYKFTSPGRAGVPDRMYITPAGVVFFIEFKTPTGRLSALQVNEHRILREHVMDVFVVDNVDDGKRIIDKRTS